ncbi:MAG TPA: ABC transporter ATP-binding protein/permease [Candidatus Binataceae bacterium]|nr:ABC transporter ATP-binding protein/permease [Candidatus Binataceae bacterium]
MNRFDRVFWRRLWSLTRGYWLSDQRRRGVIVFVLVLILGGASIGLSAYFTYLLRDATNALVAKNANQFYHELEIFLGWLALMVPVAAYLAYLIGRLTILWREWMTHQFVALGFQDRSFYRMMMLGEVDNPDQRISEDINSFVGGWLVYILLTISSIATAATFIGILWSISHFLTVALLLYSAAGTYLSVLVGRRLVRINFDQKRYEADFRFGLVHVRDNIEPILMYGGEQHETNQLSRRFSNVVRNYNLLILWQRHLKFVTESYNNLIVLLPYFLLAGQYFAGHLQYGQLSQAAAVFGSVQGALSLVVSNFDGFTGFAAVVNRLATFVEECDSARVAAAEAGIETVEDGRVAFEHITVLTPDRGKSLVADLNVDASTLGPMLVKGPSGVGKTSLLRALAGIWRTGNGTIRRPPLSEVMFLPQRPYMILGSLREQLTYPHAGNATDAELQAILADVNLANLPDRFGGLDLELQWSDVLSPGEQQRLAFARLLLNRPRYAFLDEATSALDPDNEENLYRRLARSGIEFLSSGHRPSLQRFHRTLLELHEGERWRLQPSPGFDDSTRAA